MNVTMEYIARVANVSKATVSRVINNNPEGVSAETRERVQKVIERYSYRPNLMARSIVTSRTKTIGLIIPDITNPFFPAVVRSIEQCAAANGYTIILCNTDSSPEKEDSSISTLIANRVDGVILATTTGEKQPMHERFEKYDIPCVLIDRRIRGLACGAGVYIDNEYAMYLAAERLIRTGNKSIGLALGPAFLSTSVERLEGYRAALLHYGIEYRPELVLAGEYSIESGYAVTRALLSSKNAFTAVLTGSDVIAFGVIKALREAALRVPDDIEVIGFDNIPASEMIDPPLTTVEQPISELGLQAARALLTLMDGGTLEQTSIRLEPRMLLRKSTKQMRNGDMRHEKG